MVVQVISLVVVSGSIILAADTSNIRRINARQAFGFAISQSPIAHAVG